MVKLKTKITLTKIKKIKEWGSNWKKKKINFDLRMKLKIDKTFIKGLRRKIKNKKNKDRIEKIIYDKLELNH